MTEDESRFLDIYLSDHMFATSRDEVIRKVKATIGGQRVMLTVFISGPSLTTADALLSGA
jgi:hypothetical protein